MAKKYLNKKGLATLWADIVQKFATKDVATQSADGLMTSTDKSKLDGIENGANNYTLPTMSADTRGGAKLGTGLRVDEGSLSLGDIVTDSCDGLIYAVDAEGWSEQVSTVGKNLLRPFESNTSNGISLIKNNDGSITLNGTSTSGFSFLTPITTLAAGEYTISSGVTLPDGVYLSFANKSELMVRPGSSMKTGTLSEEEGNYFYLWIDNGKTFSNVTLYPQIEAGSTPTSYEPYSGAKPSPSPEYPQEIEVCRGRNLWNDSSDTTGYIVKGDDGTMVAVSGYTCSDYIPVEANADYYIQGGIGSSTMHPGAVYDSSKTYLRGIALPGSGVTSGAVNFGANAAFVRINRLTSSTTPPQLELGSIPTPHVPFGHVGLEVNLIDLDPNDWEQGSFNPPDGIPINSTSRIRNSLKPVTPGEEYTITINPGYYVVLYAYDDAGLFVASDSLVNWQIAYPFTWKPETATQIRVAVRNPTSTDIVPNDARAAGLGINRTTTPIPLPSKGWAGGLPDGTADALAIDSAGKWEWTCVSGMINQNSQVEWIERSHNENRYIFNTVAPLSIGLDVYEKPPILSTHLTSVTSAATWKPGDVSVFSKYSDVSGKIGICVNQSLTTMASVWAAYPTLEILYPLATPTTEHGYIDLPDVYEGCQVDIPELREVGVKCFVPGAAELAIHAANWGHRNAEMESRLAAVESALAELATA